MNPSTTGMLVLVAAAGLLAWSLGGDVGAGVLAGALLGAGVSGWTAAWQRSLIRTRPELALASAAGGFLLKLVLLVAFTLLFRFVEPARSRIDGRSFLVAFAATVVILLILSAPESARALKERNAS